MVPIIIFAPNGPLPLKKQGAQGEEQNKTKWHGKQKCKQHLNNNDWNHKMMTFAIENNTKNNLLEGTKQQRTRIITKRNL